MSEVGKVTYKICGDNSQFSTDINQTQSIASKASAAISGAFKVAGVAIGAAIAGVVSLGKQSIVAYSQYEQLVGGVETLFGAGGKSIYEYAESVGKSVQDVSADYLNLLTAQKTVLANADNAYKTAGMSANDYMTIVTSSAASLVNSLGGDTEKAAKYADMAITDMSDNANKMGTSMESITFAYQGFAKQNYTMLDNLKLGYGGTRGEMERLIADAEKLTGLDLDISSYADVVTAIHAIQTEMGITGTTAAEASDTIQGSVNSMKAAWENFLTGMADPTQNFDKLVGNLVDSVVTVLDNLVPRITAMLPRLVEGISAVLQTLLTSLPETLKAIIPTITDSAMSLLNTAIAVLPELITVALNQIPALISGILKMLPQLLNAGIKIAMSLIQGLTKTLPGLIPQAIKVIFDLINTIVENLPALIDAGIELAMALLEGIISALPQIIEALPQIITGIINALMESQSQIIQAGIDLLSALVDGLPEIIAAITEALPELIVGIVTGLLENLPALITAGIQLWGALIQAIPEAILLIWDAIPQIINAIIAAFVEAWPEIKAAGIDVLNAFIDGMKSLWETVKATGSDIIKKIGEGIAELWDDVKTWGSNVVDKIGEGIHGAWEAAKSWGAGIIGNVLAGIQDAWQGVVDWFSSAWDSLFGSTGSNVKLNAKAVAGRSRGMVAGSYASGLDYVPYDGFIAELHKGERVQTAADNIKFSALGGLQGMESLAQNPASASAGTPVQVTLHGDVYMDGYSVGKVVLENLDDVAAFTIGG